MSTGAVINPTGGGAVGIGMATPTSQGTRPLTSEAVFRIEVSLSSRRSSAIVMKTTARLYSLEGAVPSVPGASPGKDAEWKPVAYGAPCIQLMRENTQHNSPFHLKLVIAEVESGIALWEQEVNRSCQYSAMQNNFHTFSVGGKTYAIQFANDSEAERMLESVVDLFEQKEKAETVSFDKKPVEPIFKKPKSIRKLNKKDISTPCNFKHVSGITLQRTQTCEDELRGTIQRKIRSMSLSSLSHRKARQERAQGGKGAAPNGPVVTEVRDVELEGGPTQFKGLDVSPMIARKAAGSSSRAGRSNSILNKFGSLKISKKKHYAQPSESGQPTEESTDDGSFVRDKNRMSLPSHYRQKPRPALTSDLFNGSGPTSNQLGQPVKALSLSSDNLADPNSTAHNTVSSPTRKAATLERRHTFVGPTSPRRKSPGGGGGGGGGATQFNYTPYSKSIASSPQHQPAAALPQQQAYNPAQFNGGGAPYYYGKSATLGTHSAQHFHQQMKGYSTMQGGEVGGVRGVANGTNLTGSGGRLHVSDMGLHRTGMTGQAGYQGPAQNPANYGPPKRRVSMNEMQVFTPMDGRGLSRKPLSSSGGIPVQPAAPMDNGLAQQHPYLQQGQPRPQMVAPPTAPIPMSAPPTSAVITPTPTSSNYPVTATAAQIPQGGYSVPPGVTSVPQYQPYPVQSGQYSGQQSRGNFPSGPTSPTWNSLPPHSHARTNTSGDPLPYAVSSAAQPMIRPTNQQTSPGRGRSVGVGGASVLSKLAPSPGRHGSVSQSGGGHRPREVVATTVASSSHYDHPPQRQVQAGGAQQVHDPGSHYQTPRSGSTAAPLMMAPPPTKFTNVQLHQRYHQQYLQLQKQVNKTTPYQSQGPSSRPSMQRYQQEYQRQQQLQRQQPPPVAKKSPPKNRLSPSHSHGQTHMAPHMNGSPSHTHNHAHGQMYSGGQYPPEAHYQVPNNATTVAAGSSPQRAGRALPNMHVNNTHLSNGSCNRELVASVPNHPSPKFQPQSTQPYDALPTTGNESVSDISTLDVDESLASVTDELDRFTEEMSKALEQFDSLLQPQTSNPIIHTPL